MENFMFREWKQEIGPKAKSICYWIPIWVKMGESQGRVKIWVCVGWTSGWCLFDELSLGPSAVQTFLSAGNNAPGYACHSQLNSDKRPTYRLIEVTVQSWEKSLPYARGVDATTTTTTQGADGYSGD